MRSAVEVTLAGPLDDEPDLDKLGLPEIICGSESPDEGLKRWTALALAALAKSNRPPILFQRGGALARIKPETRQTGPTIDVASIDALRGILDRSARWGNEYIDKRGQAQIKWGPPRLDVVRDVAALAGWDAEIIPYLEAIVEAPRFLADGTLLLTPGHHPASGLYYAPRPDLVGLDVPERPCAAEILAALSLIFDELLVDFPFANRASRANSLACMLLPFVRLMIDGPTPFHMFEASTHGTGKGKLASVLALPALGRELQSTPQKEDPAEWRKAVTSALKSGRSHIFVDNMYMPVRLFGRDPLPVPIDSAVLASALTERIWVDRLLGASIDLHIRINCTWMGAGNNVEFSPELSRRVIPIRLDARTERPWERDGFRHPLPKWAVDHRRELVHACLILCQAWIARGRPDGSKTLGSYEDWARVMSGILETIGVEGFIENTTKEVSPDQESPRWSALFAAWYRVRGGMLTASGDVREIILDNTDLTEAFSDVLGDGSESSQKKRLGKSLALFTDRVFSDLALRRSTSKSSTGNALYKLVPAAAPTETADEGADHGGSF